MSRVTETVMRKHYAAFFMRDGVRRLSAPAYVEMDHPRADISVDKVRRFPRDTFLSCIYSAKKKNRILDFQVPLWCEVEMVSKPQGRYLGAVIFL